MTPQPFDDMTRRIANLMICHKSGVIKPEVYTRELRAIQNEFLTPATGAGSEKDHGE